MYVCVGVRSEAVSVFTASVVLSIAVCSLCGCVVWMVWWLGWSIVSILCYTLLFSLCGVTIVTAALSCLLTVVSGCWVLLATG